MDIEKICKFRTGSERDIEALHGQYIWFSDIESLNDPFEGRVKLIDSTEDDIEECHALLLSMRKSIEAKILIDNINDDERELILNVLTAVEENFSDVDKSVFSKNINLIYKYFAESHIKQVRDKANVFSASNAKSIEIIKNPVLWGTYGNSFSGMCIIYDLRELLKGREELYPISVNYDRKPIKALDVVKMLSLATNTNYNDHPIITKSADWQHENEVRLLSFKKGAHYHNEKAIQEIYLAERMPSWKREAIINIATNKYPNCKFKIACYDEITDAIVFNNI